MLFMVCILQAVGEECHHKSDDTSSEQDPRQAVRLLRNLHASLALTRSNLAALSGELSHQQRGADDEGDHVAGRDTLWGALHAFNYSYVQGSASVYTLFLQATGKSCGTQMQRCVRSELHPPFHVFNATLKKFRSPMRKNHILLGVP